MEKTKVRTKQRDDEYGEYEVGEEGFIDGYVQAADKRPYAVVVIGNRILLIGTWKLEALTHNPQHDGKHTK